VVWVVNKAKEEEKKKRWRRSINEKKTYVLATER